MGITSRGAPIKFFPIPIRSDIFICIFPDTDTDHRYTAGYTGGIKKLSIYSHLLIIATCRIDFNWKNSATANKMLHGNYLKINLFQIYMLLHTVHELYYTTQGLKFCTVFHTGMISQGLLMRSKKKIKNKEKKVKGMRCYDVTKLVKNAPYLQVKRSLNYKASIPGKISLHQSIKYLW